MQAVLQSIVRDIIDPDKHTLNPLVSILYVVLALAVVVFTSNVSYVLQNNLKFKIQNHKIFQQQKIS